MDPETLAMIQMLMGGGGGGGMDPFLMSQLFGMVQPEMNAEGEPQVFDATNQAKGLNLAQDYFGSMADLMPAMLGGAGSFGNAPVGGGMVGGGGLRPITTESILETPQTSTLRVMAQNPATLEGFIANGLLKGHPASVIYADLKSKIEDPEGNGVSAQMMQRIAAGLPTIDKTDVGGNPTGETVIDWTNTRKMIDSDYAMPYMKEQGMLSGPNIKYNDYGQPVALSQKPSKMMEWLSERGYSSPEQQYDIDYALQSDPQMMGMLEQLATRGQAYEDAKSAYSKYLSKEPMANRMDAMLKRREGERGRSNQDQLRKFFDQYKAATGGESGLSAAVPETGHRGPEADFRTLPTNPETAGYRGMGPQWRTQPEDVETAGFRGMGPQFRTPQGADEVEPFKPSGPNMFERAMQRAVAGRSNALEDKLRFGAQRQNSMMGRDAASFARMLAPTYQAQRAGRTPFGDQVAQRMAVVNMLMGR